MYVCFVYWGGYKGVYRFSGGRYYAKCHNKPLGSFDTAVEAAVAYARYVELGEEGMAEAAAEAAAAARGLVTEAGGVKLHLSRINPTGYKVSMPPALSCSRLLICVLLHRIETVHGQCKSWSAFRQWFARRR